MKERTLKTLVQKKRFKKKLFFFATKKHGSTSIPTCLLPNEARGKKIYDVPFFPRPRLQKHTVNSHLFRLEFDECREGCFGEKTLIKCILSE